MARRDLHPVPVRIARDDVFPAKSRSYAALPKGHDSADCADVMFEHTKGRIAVDVKASAASDAELERGIYQCVKYQALLRAELTANCTSWRAPPCAGDGPTRRSSQPRLSTKPLCDRLINRSRPTSRKRATFVGPPGDDPPRSIAHYRISAKIGEGGMGTVYRATDTKLGREVAIKVLPADFAEDPVRMARFNREAKVLASLNHPNIASVYGVEDRALVMELVEGRELRGPLPIEEAIPIAR
jgi:hypothetical protein